MTTANLTDKDLWLRNTVLRQLEWDPQVDVSAVGVAAHDGVVTLSGYIDTYAGKLAAERATKRVAGVRAVANDLNVRLRLDRTDPDIASDVAQALAFQATVPDEVQAAVHNGHVTLTGIVHWYFQKVNAAKAIRHIRGVKDVRNHIEVAPRPVEGDVRRRIVAALQRDADIDARHVTVAVSRDTAILSGTVHTWLQREAAERAAADAPGIRRVDCRILVQPLRTEGPDEAC